MPQCVICKKDYPSAAPVLAPPCSNCGFNASTPDQSINNVANKIWQTGTQKIGAEPIAGEILMKAGTDPLAQKRVKRMLNIFLSLNSCADMVANLVDEAPSNKRLARIAAVDNALRAQDPEGQEMLGALNHATLSADRNRLLTQCTQGWTTVKTKWSTLTDDYKVHFLKEIFEHDKGYPQSVQSAVNYVRPDQLSMSAVLLNILYRGGNTDIYSGMSSSTSMETGARIKAGWAGADKDKRNMMWFTLMTMIGGALNTHDGDVIVKKLADNRKDVVEQLSSFVPPKDAEAFVDGGAKDAWDKFM
jgi:hypothetical protein